MSISDLPLATRILIGAAAVGGWLLFLAVMAVIAWLGEQQDGEK